VKRGLPGEGLGVGGKSGCVPAVVSGELTAQVAWWVSEGTQELHRHNSSVSAPCCKTSQSPIQWATDIPKDKRQILCN